MKKYGWSLLAILSVSAMADMQVAKIVGFVPFSIAGKEVFIFKLEGNPAGGCNDTGRYAINSDQLHFKATQSSLIAAYHAQTTVTVNYSKSCNIYPNAWDTNYVCTGPINC